jgi:hypothetical protein
MAGAARTPRSRGSACGILLVLLGAWGGLAPFVGPYFHFGYSPDRAWAYSSGRLYLSILPAAAAVLGGVLVLATRSRAVGILGGVLAALGGAWFAVGHTVILAATKRTTISPGVPLHASAIVIPTIRQVAEELSFFTGLGILIVFVAAIAIGRFSLLAAKDAGPAAGSSDADYGAVRGYPPPAAQVPGPDAAGPDAGSIGGLFPSSDQTVEVPRPTGQYPPGQYPPGQYPPRQYPPSS